MDLEGLAQFLGQHLQGSIEGQFRDAVSLSACEVDVERNPDFDTAKCDLPGDGFLYYRCFLEIEPKPGIEFRDYVVEVARLLECLWEGRVPAVAACDFEDKLPRGGSWVG
jgi:hypothetical protein